MLHLYTGDGKGKTSAAVGLAVRALGHDRSVMFCQFMKDGRSGELRILEKLRGVCMLHTPPMQKWLFEMSEEERRQILQQQTETCRMIREKSETEKPDIVILDELATACSLGTVDEEEARNLVDTVSAIAETVVTGRDAPAWLWERADYLSDIHCVRHPYAKGMSAREGVEW